MPVPYGWPIASGLTQPTLADLTLPRVKARGFYQWISEHRENNKINKVKVNEMTIIIFVTFCYEYIDLVHYQYY